MFLADFTNGALQNDPATVDEGKSQSQKLTFRSASNMLHLNATVDADKPG